MRPINENTLIDYQRHVEEQARLRALALGPGWPGAPCETEFFLAAMSVFVFMDAAGHVPDAWVEFLNPAHPRKSIVQPGRKEV